MSTLKPTLLLAAGMVLSLGLIALSAMMQAPRQLQASPLTPTPLVDPDADLRQHVEHLISLANPQISQGRNKAIESMLVDIATRVFSTRQEQRYWVALVGIESRYDGRSRSPKGAVGLGQLMPAYKRDFGAGCGLTDVTDEDIRDDYLNAMLSACFFRSLIEMHDGDLSLALVAYNSGAYSTDTAKAKRGQQPSKEPREYRAKVTARAEMK